MGDTITRLDQVEVASFLDRIALFSSEGCKPQEALRYSWISLHENTPLYQALEPIIDGARDGKSSAEVLLALGQRLRSEGLVLASMAFTAHIASGVDLGGPLTNLAGVIRRQATMPFHHGTEFDRELAVALFADKMGYLAAIGKPPRDALAVLAEHDVMLGAEILQISRDLQSGCSLPEALARSAERTGSKATRLMAEAMEVSATRGIARDTVLHHVAEVIRRNPSA